MVEKPNFHEWAKASAAVSKTNATRENRFSGFTMETIFLHCKKDVAQESPATTKNAI